MTIQDLVQGARDRLIRAGISANLAGLDAEVLARRVLGWDQARFLVDRHEPASSAFLLNYEHYVARRMRREPISYIIGTREFWSLDFEVTPDVLIPRPETELIIEEAIKRFRETGVRPLFPTEPPAAIENRGLTPVSAPLFIDVGTGSGVLAIVLAKEFSKARVIATDVSAGELRVARRNAERHGVADRITFVETSSNPPYVPAISAAGLTPEVLDYEPSVAVFGGEDGLEGLRRVFEDAIARLTPGAWLIVEFGYGQEEAVRSLVEELPALSLVSIRGDLQDIPRTAVVQKRP